MLALDRVHRMDAFDGLKGLADESVDLIVTDPPYNIASKSKPTIRHGRVVSTMEAWGAWDTFHPFDYDILIFRLISEAYRVLRPGGGLYIFTSRENNGFYIRHAVARGFVYRNQLVMVKSNPLPSLAKTNWRSAFEVTMYLTKGKPAVFNFISQKECVNVYPYAVTHKETTHPTEKPLGLIERIVRVSSNDGDLVLDPFMGSGTTAVACVLAGRRYLGFDTNAGYVRMAQRRIAEAQKPVREAA